MELRPPTQRVPTRRSAPVLVAIAALGALVVFVARPWDDHSPQPSPVALATTEAIPAPTLTEPPTIGPSSTPTPTSPPPVLPPPDLGPADAPGTVALSGVAGSPVVRCSYGRLRHGTRRLIEIEVQPPIVMLDARAQAIDISHVAWRFQLEMNQQRGVFDRDWQVVGASRMQATGTAQGRPASFTALTLRPRANEMTDTAVYRVRLVVEWFTRNLEPAGRSELLAAPYQAAHARPGAPPWPYCAAVLRSS